MGGSGRWWFMESESAVRNPLVWSALLVASALTAACSTAPVPNSLGEVSISIVQERSDVSNGQLVLKVTNTGPASVTVAKATLESFAFAEPLEWQGESSSTVLAGRALDLRVDIPAVECDAESAAASVTLESSEGSITLEPQDPYELIDRLHSEGCLEKNIAVVAAFTADRLVSPSVVADPADLVISIQPSGNVGVVVVESIRDTTLLSPSVDGIGVDELALNQTVSADGPHEIHVEIVPNRCDAHALAEDKVGTRMPLTVTAPDGTSGRLTLAASDELREQMYSFYSLYCGFTIAG
ncbi:hypothetical protein A20C1_08103 [marine actinobacterium PHSC20C1]|nr:hypothetical protein A20C1_08103 [marine actinobacterium PHSC20C1]